MTGGWLPRRAPWAVLARRGGQLAAAGQLRLAVDAAVPRWRVWWWQLVTMPPHPADDRVPGQREPRRGDR